MPFMSESYSRNATNHFEWLHDSKNPSCLFYMKSPSIYPL